MQENTDLRELLAKGQIGQAIDLLLNVARRLKDRSMIMQLIQVKGHYRNLEDQKKLGIVPEEIYHIEQREITYTIRYIYRVLERLGDRRIEEYEDARRVLERYGITLWSINGERINSFDDSEEYVKRVVFHPDGLSFLSCNNRRGDFKVGKSNAKLWSTEGEWLHTFNPDNGGVSDACFSPDGKSVLAGGHYGLITQWSVAGEKMSETRSGTGRINSVAFSPNNRVYLAGREDAFAELLSTTGEVSRIFLSSNNLARVGPFGKLAGQPFINIFPEEARLLSLEVRSGDLVDQLKLSYRLGKEEQEIIRGGEGGKAWPKFWINSPITKVTGRAGDQLDQVQLHFEDGTSTPVYGGGGGQPFSVSFTEYELMGFFGHSSSVIDRLGFYGKPRANYR